MPYKDPNVKRAYQLEWQREMRASLTPEEKQNIYDANNARRRAKYSNDPEHRRTIQNRNIVRLYGLTEQEYRTMISEQSGLCLLCHKPLFDEVRKPAVDHCHDTNKIRGILHNRCNVAIGMLKHDPELCKLAEEYLEKTN